MDFLFHLWNHSEAGKRSLEDVIGIIGHQLRALGHSAVWDPKNDDLKTDTNYYPPSRGYNVIVEGFTPSMLPVIASAHGHGARFICLATEEPTDKGFNHGTQKEMVERQEMFPEMMKFFDGIIHLVPGEAVTRWYGQFAPAAQAELGYAPSLVRRETVREPEFEFGFYGSLTERRYNLLKRLARATGKKNAVKLITDFTEQIPRDRTMQNAKVIIQVRKFDEMGLVSSSRCNTALHLGRPVVAEPHDEALSHPWDEIVKFTRSEQEFFHTALLTARRWRDAHYFQMARFREKLTPEVCIGEPLRRIGVLERARAAAAA